MFAVEMHAERTAGDYRGLNFRFHLHPYGMHLKAEGLSHGLKMCHRHIFLTAFRVPSLPKKRTPFGVLFFGARDGTRTHTAKPHAPQTCLSTIPTLSQALKYYNHLRNFCQYLFPNSCNRRHCLLHLLKKRRDGDDTVFCGAGGYKI